MDPLKIEIGKRYILRNGLVTEPIEKDDHVNFCFKAKVKEPSYSDFSVFCWTRNGRFLASTLENRKDIIREYKGEQ